MLKTSQYVTISRGGFTFHIGSDHPSLGGPPELIHYSDDPDSPTLPTVIRQFERTVAFEVLSGQVRGLKWPRVPRV